MAKLLQNSSGKEVAVKPAKTNKVSLVMISIMKQLGKVSRKKVAVLLDFAQITSTPLIECSILRGAPILDFCKKTG